MSDKIRFGILGCGKIAHKFVSDLKFVEGAELSAVASRDQVKANQFAGQYAVPLVFNTYEALATSDKVDVIYVATPHGLHHEHAILCLQKRKAVLCEKALALNSRQVREMLDVAKRQKVFLMEAFWTKFLPQYQKVTELIHAGEIGEIKWIQADFGFRAPEPLAQRLYDPKLGGGSLLDIGIYPIFLAISLLGKPIEVKASMTPYPSGVDEQCTMSLKFGNGALASLSSTFSADTPIEAVIAGTKGYIRLTNRFHNATSHIELTTERGNSTPIAVAREDGYGYQFEARHVVECLKKGLTESPVMSHADSLLLMETLDRVREVCSIHYEVD